MSRWGRSVLQALALLAAAACSGCGAAASTPAAAGPAQRPAASRASAQPAVDPLGPVPIPGNPAPFVPPVPSVWRRGDGLTVWLLERHALPIVSLQLAMRAGSASDPRRQGGLAHQTAHMLGEGAGKRGPLEIAADLDALGAQLEIDVRPDYAVVGIESLARNLAPAAAILGDVIARPRFSPREWKRAHDLWQNRLRARRSDPSAVAQIVAGRQV